MSHPGGQGRVQGGEERGKIRGGKRAVAVAVELMGKLSDEIPAGIRSEGYGRQWKRIRCGWREGR